MLIVVWSWLIAVVLCPSVRNKMIMYLYIVSAIFLLGSHLSLTPSSLWSLYFLNVLLKLSAFSLSRVIVFICLYVVMV